MNGPAYYGRDRNAGLPHARPGGGFGVDFLERLRNGGTSVRVLVLEAFDQGRKRGHPLECHVVLTHEFIFCIDGASYADVTVTETLNASISGAGVLTYAGNPKSVEKNVGGVGTIRARP